MMHGTTNIKFIDAQQAKLAYQYKNTERKLYKTNAAIWYNKIWPYTAYVLLMMGEMSPETCRVKPLQRIKRNCCILDLFHKACPI